MDPLFFYLFFYFSFLVFFFFLLFFFFFFIKKINHTKPNHSDWVHGHPIFPSFTISCKEILLCCFFAGDARRAAATVGQNVFVLRDKMFLLMIGMINVTGLHDSCVREICTLAVLCSVF